MTSPTTPVETTRYGKGGAWIALLVAGAFEVGYALSVNGSAGFTNALWSAITVVFFLLTLFFLSLALRRIDVGIGYAVWAGIGAIGAAVFGPIFFDETLTFAKAFWLAVIIAGVVWLKLTDAPEPKPTPEPEPEPEPTPEPSEPPSAPTDH